MSKPFDATLKDLLERDPAGWAAFAGHPGTSVEIIDSDTSTLTGASDKVLRVRANPDWLLDLNFQRGPDASLPRAITVLRVRAEAAEAAEAALLRLRQQIEQLPWTKSWDFRDELVKKSEVLACLDDLGASK